MDISIKILLWYNQNKRDLPWRRTKDPYKIWLSEIILQQTRVIQGLNYYMRFVETYPTIKSLAKAQSDEIMKMWQGLGYYSRARNLHAAAQYLNKNNKGQLPKTYQELLKIKGIGEYTAAAIASIAYNEPIALVDGNVYRLISRLYGIKTPINTSIAKKEFQAIANEMLNHKHPGEHNQAMMEMGALVCLPKNPLCCTCPVMEHCMALKMGLTGQLPLKIKKEKAQVRYLYYMVLSDAKNNIVINKRESDDIWKDLYDFPLLETKTALTLKQIEKKSTWDKILRGNKYSIYTISSTYKHQLTHQTLYATFVIAKMNTIKKSEFKDYIVVKMNTLEKYAVSKLVDKFLNDYKII